jgi:hypothetical protein
MVALYGGFRRHGGEREKWRGGRSAKLWEQHTRNSDPFTKADWYLCYEGMYVALVCGPCLSEFPSDSLFSTLNCEEALILLWGEPP